MLHVWLIRTNRDLNFPFLPYCNDTVWQLFSTCALSHSGLAVRPGGCLQTQKCSYLSSSKGHPLPAPYVPPPPAKPSAEGEVNLIVLEGTAQKGSDTH